MLNVQVVAQTTNAREVRKYEREMIFYTMKEFGLIKRQQTVDLTRKKRKSFRKHHSDEEYCQ